MATQQKALLDRAKELRKLARQAEAAAGRYTTHRERMAERSRERSAEGREIGPLPAVVEPLRVELCAKSLKTFCETYLPARFYMLWSPDHLKVIDKIQTAVLKGGLFAVAMPRGSGKTSLAEAAALWAILYGYRRFVVLIGATDDAACEMLDSIKLDIETNNLLGEDFPQVCYPVRQMEGINHRAGGQTLDGVRTRITWTADELDFPTIAGSPSSGSRIRVAGITGRIRGMKATTADGLTIRPDLVIPDDPQTDTSAVSPIDIDKRERRLRGAVKGMAGPDKTIAMVVPCTVIAPRDLSDRLLDRERNPQFQGERMKMLYSFPARMDLWEQYAALRRDSLRNDRHGEEATEFYDANRDEMDAGSRVGWPDRFDREHERSALQAAMNLYIDHPREFAAEYQNEPEPPGSGAGAKELRPDVVASKLSGVPRFEVPREAVRLTAMIDPGGELLWYAVVAWDQHFGGAVIDYGSWPTQSRSVFAANDPRPGLSHHYPGLSETQRVYAGLRDLTPVILSRVYYREGNSEELRIERCLIDCGWESQTIHQFCRQSVYNACIYPSKGIGRTTTARGVSEWKPRPGERAGFHWRLTMSETGRGRMVQFDPDSWKTFLYERLTTPENGRGRLLLFGRSATVHEMIAEHSAAEYAEPVTIRGATFDKWQVKPHHPDNHYLDALVGCCVAASVQGLVFDSGAAAGDPMPSKKPRKKVNIEELYYSKYPDERRRGWKR